VLLKDQVAIVTGAGRGIGFGIARALGREGAQVIIGEIEPERGRQAAEQLMGEGLKVQALSLDVTQSATCAALVDQVMGEHGRIDVLVNNAGVFVLGKAEELSEADWRLQIDVLLTGVFLMTQAVARAAMIPHRNGAVVNIASIGGMGGWPLRSAYNAAKAGVINLTQVLATEWAQHNIRLNCVSPGVTRTDMLQVAIDQGFANLERYRARVPLGRLGEVNDIANVVLFLASERASYVTGENIAVDGGWVSWSNLDALGYPE
jgi:NAD(P)-dependent dehydrogenase (short-subunit alcohol dehydrogenase family)